MRENDWETNELRFRTLLCTSPFLDDDELSKYGTLSKLQ